METETWNIIPDITNMRVKVCHRISCITMKCACTGTSKGHFQVSKVGSLEQFFQHGRKLEINCEIPYVVVKSTMYHFLLFILNLHECCSYWNDCYVMWGRDVAFSRQGSSDLKVRDIYVKLNWMLLILKKRLIGWQAMAICTGKSHTWMFVKNL